MRLPFNRSASAPRRGRNGRANSHTTTSRWLESTQEVARWERVRAAGRRWAVWGALIGSAGGVVAFAPATWLARTIESATAGRILLAEAQGTVWSGDAVAVLTGGVGSRDARALPGRLKWNLQVRGLALALSLQHSCCLNGQPSLLVKPGWGRVAVSLVGAPDWVGQWPAAWLAGLGTPWNTLQLGGALKLSAQDWRVEWVQGRWRMAGRVEIGMQHVSSRVTTLDHLGSYRLTLQGDAAGNSPVELTLSTDEGALQLSGAGSWSPSGLRFRGEATAEEAQRGALDNLLNIIGRRQGARSIITIG